MSRKGFRAIEISRCQSSQGSRWENKNHVCESQHVHRGMKTSVRLPRVTQFTICSPQLLLLALESGIDTTLCDRAAFPRNIRYPMATETLSDFLSLLETNNELQRISARVNPVLEIAEIADRVSKATAPHGHQELDQTAPGKLGGRALLFENVEGSDIPVAINTFAATGASIRRLEPPIWKRSPSACSNSSNQRCPRR